jgi:hypothetical protein
LRLTKVNAAIPATQTMGHGNDENWRSAAGGGATRPRLGQAAGACCGAAFMIMLSSA